MTTESKPDKKLMEVSEFTGLQLLNLILAIESAVGNRMAGMTPLGQAVTHLCEVAADRDPELSASRETSHAELPGLPENSGKCTADTQVAEEVIGWLKERAALPLPVVRTVEVWTAGAAAMREICARVGDEWNTHLAAQIRALPLPVDLVSDAAAEPKRSE